MKEQIGLGAFGTFGEPFGYQQVFFLTPALQNSLDLNTNAIEVYPGSELYAVKREMTDGVSSICCCLYTYAKEPASNRGGTFIGTCVVLRNCYLKGAAIYSLLKELHTDVISNFKNIVDHTLQVQKAEQLTVTEPGSFNRIKASIIAQLPSQSIPMDKSKFLIQQPAAPTDTEPIPAFFDAAVKSFGHTDTLYFTADQRIIAYVAEKGIIPTVSWEAFQDYKKQIAQQQKATIRKAETQRKVEKSSPGTKHAKSTAKTNTGKTFPYGLLEPWTNIDTHPGRDGLYQMVQNHNTLLQEYLKLSQQAVVAPSSNSNNHQPSHSTRPGRRIKRKHLVLTIFVLFALLLTTSVLLLLRPASAKVVSANNPPTTVSILPAESVIAPPPLVPLANAELPKADALKLVKDSIKGKKLEVVVDLLFIRNPKSIGEVYLGQKEAYTASLVRINKKCFTRDSSESICGCDTLLHIPAFKK